MTRLSDRDLERLLAGSLPPDEARALEARLAEDPDAAARVAALRADDEAILRAHPPARVVAEIHRRLETDRRPSRAPLLVFAAATAACALALVVVPGIAPRAETEDVVEERGKGGRPRLFVRRVAGGAAELLAHDASASAGNLLQLSFVAAGKHACIVSLDGRGGATLHLPEAEDAPTTMSPGGEVGLPHAFQLDDAPAFERFVLVTAPAPIDVPAVLSAARALAREPAGAASSSLPLPFPAEQTSLLLRKVPR